jgi:hypothetical protein
MCRYLNKIPTAYLHHSEHMVCHYVQVSAYRKYHCGTCMYVQVCVCMCNNAYVCACICMYVHVCVSYLHVLQVYWTPDAHRPPLHHQKSVLRPSYLWIPLRAPQDICTSTLSPHHSPTPRPYFWRNRCWGLCCHVCRIGHDPPYRPKRGQMALLRALYKTHPRMLKSEVYFRADGASKMTPLRDFVSWSDLQRP